jgi:hexosaminidase
MTHDKSLGTSGAALAATLAALLLAACAKRPPPREVNFIPPIIPAPAEAFAEDGVFPVSAQTAVIASGDAVVVANYFVDLVKRTKGLEFAVGEQAGDTPGIRFEISGTVRTPEGYALIVKPDGIIVTAHDNRGLLYGAVSLWQLLTAHDADHANPPMSIPAMTIGDEPRFAWRGLMLDSARHFQSPEFVEKLIDWMALHKLNVLHWHLTDDQAWRLEIKKYPKLTSVGAWRVPAGHAPAHDIDPATGKPRMIGGFYTQDQVRGVIAYAAARNVTIVPEIEMPGHASAAVVAYPALGVSRTMPKTVPSDWGVYTTLFNAEEPTFKFLEDVLGEVVDLFPGEYVHVGGDEATKDEWQASPRIQQRMKELGVKDEQALQGYFIQRMEKFLNAKGKKLVGWDEILEGGIAPNATVMSWRGIDGAIAAAKSGHDTVLSPAPQLYLDHWQSDGDPAPGRSNVLTLRQVYEFDPVPPAIGESERKHLLGVQANLWAEFMRSDDRIEYQAFPRIAALAEIAWSPANRIGWKSFEMRMPAQLARYEALGIRYAKTTQWPKPGANARTSHQLEACGDGYLLSLEDDAPIEGARAVFYVNISNPCWLWKGADLTQAVSVKATVGQIPFNFQIGKDAAGIPLPKPASRDGELEIRVGGCAGKPVATIPLSSAVSNDALTTLPAATVPAQGGAKDLCLSFTRAQLDPMWVLDRIELKNGTSGTAP